jgi:hypothetical protein
MWNEICVINPADLAEDEAHESFQSTGGEFIAHPGAYMTFAHLCRFIWCLGQTKKYRHRRCWLHLYSAMGAFAHHAGYAWMTIKLNFYK